MAGDDMITLGAAVLPMGFGWSPYCCQLAMEEQIGHCAGWSPRRRLSDHSGDFLLRCQPQAPETDARDLRDDSAAGGEQWRRVLDALDLVEGPSTT